MTEILHLHQYACSWTKVFFYGDDGHIAFILLRLEDGCLILASVALQEMKIREFDGLAGGLVHASAGQ